MNASYPVYAFYLARLDYSWPILPDIALFFERSDIFAEPNVCFVYLAPHVKNDIFCPNNFRPFHNILDSLCQ